MPSQCTITNEWFYDQATHYWVAVLMIDDTWVHIGYYVYEDDAIASGIIAKLRLDTIK